MGILATSSALGSVEVSLDDLAERHGWSADSVSLLRKAAGVERRRYAAEGVSTSQLAALAAAPLLRAALPPPSRLLLATMSPDTPVPGAAPRVAHLLGLGSIPASDVVAACSGFLFALDAAARAILTGDPAVLVVAAEIRSRFVPWDRPGTAALFGDGAGAALVGPCAPGRGILAISLSSDGGRADAVSIPAGGSREPTTSATVAAGRHVLRMEEGPQLFLEAVEGMVDAGRRCLDSLGMSWGDVDLVVPHQPNVRVVERIPRLARVPRERVWSSAHERGNMGGATVAVALDEALAAGRIGSGARVLLVAAGAGFTSGAALLCWP